MLRHKFVEFIPEKIEEGTLYISMQYCTAIHKCACGCGNEVVTPISPTDWKLTFDGRSVTLNPSIGNWNFDCQSHYWIRKGKIEFAGRWSKKQIESGREKDLAIKNNYFEQTIKDVLDSKPPPRPSIWMWIVKFFT